MPDGSTVGRFGSGREVRRIEDAGLLAGAGRFTDDFSLPGQTYLSFLRSPHAHAQILSIDATAAASMPGVVAVLTGADLVAAGVKPLPIEPMFQRPDGSPGATPLRPALADGVVRFVGEAVVALVAETAEQAKDALEAVVVEYEDLPVVTELTEAAAEGAPLVWPAATGNIAAQMKHGDAAACDAAFAGAAHVVTLDLVNQRLVPSSMEPRCALGSYDAATGRITLRLSSQMPSGARDTLCEVLNLPAEKVRVVVGDVGGGFGMKTGLYPEDIVVAYAARQIERPVKWTPTRLDEFLSSTHGRDVEIARGTRAGRGWQGAGLPGPHAGQHGCLRQHGRDHHPIDDRAVGVDQHLRHPDHRFRPAGSDPHRADRRLSRRRAAGGDLPHRASDGCRRAEAGAGPGRDQAPEPDRARTDAVHQRDGAGV